MNAFTPDDYRRMDAYARGELPADERRAFEQALLTDDALAREYRWLRAAEADYARLRRQELFSEMHHELFGGTPAAETPVRPLWPRWARPLAAASVAGLLALGWWVLRDSRRAAPPVAVSSEKRRTPKPVLPNQTPAPATPDPQGSAATWQAHLRQPPKGLGASPAGLEAVARALSAGQARTALRRLDAAEAATAEPLLGSSRETTERKPTRSAAPDPRFRNLYRAVCYLQLNQPDKALASLNRVREPDLQPTADWYRALAHWQRGQRAEARQRLGRIARRPQHPYRREAEALLAQLPES